MKKVLLLTALLMAVSVKGYAQYDENDEWRRNGVFNHLAIGLSAGTAGFGVNLAAPLSEYAAVRAGVSFMPSFAKFNAEAEGYVEAMGQREHFTMDIECKMKSTQSEVIFNVYPFGHRSNFFIGLGAFFGDGKAMRITGHSDELSNLTTTYPFIQLGDYEVPVDQHGNVDGGIEHKSFRPYLGIGFGRPIPRRRVSVMLDLGVQFDGKKRPYTNYGTINEGNLADLDETLKTVLDLPIYPMIRISINGKIF